MKSELNLPAILARIEARLDAVGMSATAASRAAGKPDAIRNIRRAVESKKRQGVSTVTLSALAPILETSAEWLVFGQGAPDAGKRKIPIVGFASAGGGEISFQDGQGPFGEVDAPAGANDNTVAVEIRGSSLGRLLDGWIAFYDDRRETVDESLLGALCVCGLEGGGVVIKRLRKGSAPGLYHLESATEGTLFDQPVTWAAKVRELRPA